MNDFIWLLFAHYLGDIALQTTWQAQNKGKYWYVMFSHCMIWAACVCIALTYINLYAFWKVLFLVGGHALSDKLKSLISQTPKNWKYIYPDQSFHLIQLFVVYYF